MIVAIIPARRDSKRLKNKNKLLLHGKPLFLYPIEEAVKSKYIEKIVVTTNDDDIINSINLMKFDKEITVIRRPEELSQDNSDGMDAVKHVYQTLGLEPEITIILQPTSPFRGVDIIDKCIKLLILSQVDSVVTVKESTPHTFYPNGAVCVFKGYDIWSINSILLPMDEMGSIDINTEVDFKLSEILMGAKHAKDN